MASPAKPLSTFLLFTPPRRRWQGPIIDAHMHVKDLDSMQVYWEIGHQLYGITHAVAITNLETGRELRKIFGDRIKLAVPLKYENLKAPILFRKENEAHLEQMAAEGVPAVKLWFTPRFHERTNLRLDDPLLDPLFERIRKLKFMFLVHVADPDYWFAHRIHDLEQHGSKAEHYLQLTTRMEQYPDLIFQGAHFGAHPEDLDHLADLLERFPNYYLDSSATKWVAREFSRHGKRARDFLIHYADRVLFGTDLMAMREKEKEGRREHYATRFYVHQCMWEQKGVFDSPIEDDDSPEPPRFYGLNLPDEVLAKFYWNNAARLYRFKAPSGRRPVL